MSYRYRYERALVTADVVLLTVAPDADGHDALQVVLTRRTAKGRPAFGALAIPGASLRIGTDVTLEETARRTLREKCGIDGVYLEQLRTYSGADRDPEGFSVTTAYYALVTMETIMAGSPDVVVEPVDRHVALPFDHDAIVADAAARVRAKATYSNVVFKLLPARFTMSQVQAAYEAVLGRRLSHQSFRRKMREIEVEVDGTTTPLMVETGEMTKAANRPAMLYRTATDSIVTFPQRFREKEERSNGSATSD